MSVKNYDITDIRHYVRLLQEEAGIDIRYLAEGYENVDQVSPEYLVEWLEEEDQANAQHQQTYWLHLSKALIALAMLEGDGLNEVKNIESASSLSSKMRQARKNTAEAYIQLAKENCDQGLGYLQMLPIGFEAVANDPLKDAETLASFNLLCNEILSENKFKIHKDRYIYDGYCFGSGILLNVHKDVSSIDWRFIEDRKRQGQPINIQEYERYTKINKKHAIEWVDTFEVIRDRHAKWVNSSDFNDPSHMVTTRIRNLSNRDIATAFPRFKPNNSARVYYSELNSTINPKAELNDYANNRSSLLETWIRLPLSYDLEYEIDYGYGVKRSEKEHVERVSYLYVARVPDYGIVDVRFDQYQHGQHPMTMWQRRSSVFHGCGIGVMRDMHQAEWAFNVAFNGKFRYLSRMVKGGGFYIKGAISKEQVEARTNGAYIEIDPDKLPEEFRTMLSIDEVIKDTRPQNFPTVYNDIENLGMNLVGRSSGFNEVSGRASGYSGRQEAILLEQSQRGMSPVAQRLEDSMISIGQKFFSNIIQFDGETPMQFTVKDEDEQLQQVQLNIEEDPYIATNEFGEPDLKFNSIRNSLKDFDYKTEISTRSVMPANPTERRFFMEDAMQKLLPMVQNLTTLPLAEAYDKFVFNGALSKMLQDVRMRLEQQQAQAQQMQAEQMQSAKENQEYERKVKATELAQNQKRLADKKQVDILKAVNK